MCKKVSDLYLGDGKHTIYLSTKGKNKEAVPETLVNFLKFVSSGLEESTKDFHDDFINAFDGRCTYLNFLARSGNVFNYY